MAFESTTVHVSLDSRSYPIHIGESDWEKIVDYIRARFSTKHLVIVSDTNVAAIYLDLLVEKLSGLDARIDTLVVPAGENSKSIEQTEKLWQSLHDLKTDRSSVIVALGGGVVGDLAGFAAATYMRGIRFVQIPTSLLAQVDSSVGGKTGINLPTGKNLVGSFLQPELVVISTSSLDTLDEANFRAGMAEVVKYGVIMDAEFFSWLEANTDAINARSPAALKDMIATCCRCKARVVEEDERETTGRRAILNYGHTFGHAIEAVFGYGRYLHGEAISIGMTCAARLATHRKMVSEDFATRQTKLLKAFGLPTDCPAEKNDQLLSAMKQDKKSSNGQVNLILPTKVGNVELVPWPGDAEVIKALTND